MKKIGEVYGPLCNQLLASFPVQPRDCLSFHADAPLALEAQARRAEAIRRQCDTQNVEAEELDGEKVSACAAVPSVETFDIDDVMQGPARVARKLCHAARLNEDKMRAIALFAKPMQDAWTEAR